MADTISIPGGVRKHHNANPELILYVEWQTVIVRYGRPTDIRQKFLGICIVVVIRD